MSGYGRAMSGSTRTDAQEVAAQEAVAQEAVAQEDQPARAQRSARLIFTTTVLVLEAFVVFFATLVAIGLDLAEPAVVWTVGGAGSAVLLLLSGLVRYRVGLVLGSIAQVLLIAAGVMIPMMVVIGLVFAVIWVVALRLGYRIDIERAERDHAERHAAARGAQSPDGPPRAGQAEDGPSARGQ